MARFLALKSLININMRCIEIVVGTSLIKDGAVININMRCIEMVT